MTRYTVIENTPGYLPESDDPPIFETADAAAAYLAGEIDRYVAEIEESGHVADVQTFGDDTALPAALVYFHASGDLGRYFAVEIVEEEEE